MIPPDIFYPTLLCLFLLLNIAVCGTAIYGWLKTKVLAFFILIIGSFVGGISNISDLLVTVVRIADKSQDWKVIVMTAYNINIFASPVAAILSATAFILLCLRVIKAVASITNSNADQGAAMNP
jgi:hypothetical protein